MAQEENNQNTNRILAILYVIPIPLLAIAVVGIFSTYNYYNILRYVVFVVCLAVLLIGWLSKDMPEKEPLGFVVANILIAVTYNPFAPLSLFRGAWVVIDLVVLIYFIVRVYMRRKDLYGGDFSSLDDMWLLHRLFKVIKQQHSHAQMNGNNIIIPSSITLIFKSTGRRVVFFSVYVSSGQVFLNLLANIPFLCSDVLPRENFEKTVDTFFKVNIYELQHVMSEDTLTLFHVLKQEPFRRSVTTRDCFNRFSKMSMEAFQNFVSSYNSPLYNRLWPKNTAMPEHVNKIGEKLVIPVFPERAVANEPVKPMIKTDSECRATTLSDCDPVAKMKSDPPGFWPVTSLFSAYLKQNKDYYLRKFSHAEGSNFSAFWLGGFWLFYRKMVVLGFVYLVLLLGAYIINIFIPYVGLILGLILHIVLGLTANNFYRRHVVQKIDRLRGGSYEAAIKNLRAQPDTSLLLFFVGWVVWFLMVFVAVFLIDLLIAMIGVYA